MMRKLAIASLLVTGVALSGSVLAQDTGASASTPTSATATKHDHHKSSSTGHKAHKSKKANAAEPASNSTAGK